MKRVKNTEGQWHTLEILLANGERVRISHTRSTEIQKIHDQIRAAGSYQGVWVQALTWTDVAE